MGTGPANVQKKNAAIKSALQCFFCSTTFHHSLETTISRRKLITATSPSKNEHEANEKNNHVTANLQFSWTR
jgi:hypothetical protein